jgi:hypothetical protein
MKKAIVLLGLMIPLIISAETYGIGLIIGSPTGFSGKYYVTRESAVQMHAGWSFIGDVGFHVTADYLFLFPGVIKGDDGAQLENVIPYLGVGGRLRLKKNETTDETDLHLGMRIGGGIEYLINRFGVFLEIFPVVDFVPETGFDFEGGLGFRFYL